jgi:hypothetical protein
MPTDVSEEKVISQKIELALFSTCFHAGFLLVLFFYPEDGGNMFLRNVG